MVLEIDLWDHNIDCVFIYYHYCQYCIYYTCSNAWPGQAGSAINRIKTNKRSALKSGALNALIMILINRPKCGTSEGSYLIKQALISFGKRKTTLQKSFCITRKRNFHTNIGLGDSN